MTRNDVLWALAVLQMLVSLPVNLIAGLRQVVGLWRDLVER